LQQKNHAVTLSLLPPPWWDGEENQKKKKQKLLGWDKNSLAEWQREKKTTINNTDEKAYTTHSVLTTQCSACS